MENTEMKISQRLKYLKSQFGYSDVYLGEYLDVHRETYKKYEENPLSMDTGLLLQLLQLYNIPAPIFFEELNGKMPFEDVLNSKKIV